MDQGNETAEPTQRPTSSHSPLLFGEDFAKRVRDTKETCTLSRSLGNNKTRGGSSRTEFIVHRTGQKDHLIIEYIHTEDYLSEKSVRCLIAYANACANGVCVTFIYLQHHRR